MKNLTLSLLLLCGLSQVVYAQFYEEPFDDGGNAWAALSTDFGFNPNGTATAFAGWDNRSRIRSESEGGAMIFNGPGDQGRANSPVIDLPAGATNDLFLSFYQYSRTQGGRVRVLATTNVGQVLDTILELDLLVEEETSAGNFHIIEIEGLTTADVNISLEISFVGPFDFVILDDVALSRTRPERPSFPRYLGESLTTFGIPFNVDSAGAPFVPFQLVAQMVPGVSELQRQLLRDSLDAVLVSSCTCDRIEVWEMPGGIFFDPITGEPLGDPTDVLCRTLPGEGDGTIDGVGLNYYNYNDLENNPPLTSSPLSADEVSVFRPAPTNAVRIAILDTGLDLDHPDVASYIYRDPDVPGNNADDDNDCLTDNPIGWNYVDNNNNPNDDNGHGTHVTGVIARELDRCGGCTVQLLPYKTHNSYGVGTLFDAACATLQAGVEDDADIINASWGFYGSGGNILKNAIDTAAAYGALYVAAAGNDSLNMVADPQYPALYDLGNIVSVNAHDTLPAETRPVAPFSNYHNSEVDLAAFGVDVLSSLPGGLTGLKSGTSMATPLVVAAAARYHCNNSWQPIVARAFLLSNAFKDGPLLGYAQDGNALNTGLLCPPETIGQILTAAGDFEVKFRPDGGLVEVIALQGLGRVQIALLDAGGATIARRVVDSFLKGDVERFSLADAPNGKYLITFSRGGKVSTRRLVKR